jgi:hypothetical protein
MTKTHQFMPNKIIRNLALNNLFLILEIPKGYRRCVNRWTALRLLDLANSFSLFVSVLAMIIFVEILLWSGRNGSRTDAIFVAAEYGKSANRGALLKMPSRSTNIHRSRSRSWFIRMMAGAWPPHSPNFGGTYACTRISKWPLTLFEGVFEEIDSL